MQYQANRKFVFANQITFSNRKTTNDNETNNDSIVALGLALFLQHYPLKALQRLNLWSHAKISRIVHIKEAVSRLLFLCNKLRPTN